MLREMTRQLDRTDSAPVRLDHLQIQVSHSEKTVRVSLSGTLDCVGVDKLISRVAPRLVSRGCRIILDGSRLTHLDFRATHSLIRWNRQLREFNHQLYLNQWSDYLKAILVMEDWDRELGAAGSEPATWRLLGATSTASRP
jgi:MFS superfamily sulfate permease-like transporter